MCLLLCHNTFCALLCWPSYSFVRGPEEILNQDRYSCEKKNVAFNKWFNPGFNLQAPFWQSHNHMLRCVLSYLHVLNGDEENDVYLKFRYL